MKIKLNINEDKTLTETTLNITTPLITPEITNLVQRINYILNEKNQIIGYINNNIYVINTSEIIEIYSEDKYNYCKTKDGIYRIKEPLYILEDILPKNKFIRISNSVIVNIEYIKCFNTSLIGKIIVILKNNEQLVVSKSKTKNITNFFEERKYKNE